MFGMKSIFNLCLALEVFKMVSFLTFADFDTLDMKTVEEVL